MDALTPEEIQEMADRLEVPTDVPGQLRALATDLDRIGKVLKSPATERLQIEAAAGLLRDIAGCLRTAALRVPREDQS